MYVSQVPPKAFNTSFFLLFLVAGILSITSCARVPQQAVILSSTVGERIADLEASHEAFVSAYFGLTRDRIEDFLTERWIPTFLGKFVKEAKLVDELMSVQPLTSEQLTRLTTELQNANIQGAIQLKILQAVNSALGDPDRGELVLVFSELALKKIEERRNSLIDPIDELERRTLEELRKAYSQLKQAQSTVTAHLSSIRKVTEEQDKVLERLGLLRKRDQIVETAIKTSEEIMGILDAGKGAADTLKELEAKLKIKKTASQ